MPPSPLKENTNIELWFTKFENFVEMNPSEDRLRLLISLIDDSLLESLLATHDDLVNEFETYEKLKVELFDQFKRKQIQQHSNSAKFEPREQLPEEKYADFAKYIDTMVKANFKKTSSDDLERFKVKLFTQNLHKATVRNNLYKHMCMEERKGRQPRLADYIELAEIENVTQSQDVSVSPSVQSMISTLINQQLSEADARSRSDWQSEASPPGRPTKA